jgi:hypothetical protein
MLRGMGVHHQGSVYLLTFTLSCPPAQEKKSFLIITKRSKTLLKNCYCHSKMCLSYPETGKIHVTLSHNHRDDEDALFNLLNKRLPFAPWSRLEYTTHCMDAGILLPALPTNFVPTTNLLGADKFSRVNSSQYT